MAVHEWIAAAYFGAFGLAAWLFRAGRGNRILATTLSLGGLLAAILASELSESARAWFPHGYLIAGYWAPALLARWPKNWWFENWLVASDGILRSRLPPVRGLAAVLGELAYLFCYPLVPISFAPVWVYGGTADIARFWTAVLLAGYSCYATLPWLVSRPPRLREVGDSTSGWVSGVNAFVLGRVSHQLNTFPSGHVAVAAAAAASVASVSLAASGSLMVVVAAIGAGAIAGRYHYVIDVLLGLVVAVIAVAVSRFA